MLTGKKFKLTRPTVGIQHVEGTAKIVTIPADGIITVVSGPNLKGKPHEKGLVYALWEEQTVALFAIDVEMRGIEFKRAGDNHHPDKSATA